LPFDAPGVEVVSLSEDLLATDFCEKVNFFSRFEAPPGA
jgi:hypothetical protein